MAVPQHWSLINHRTEQSLGPGFRYYEVGFEFPRVYLVVVGGRKDLGWIRK